MQGNIETAARVLADAIRYAADAVTAAIRQNYWAYQPYIDPPVPLPSQPTPSPYQYPSTTPSFPSPTFPTVTCGTLNTDDRLRGCIAMNQADGDPGR